jgi:hypothetical protein
VDVNVAVDAALERAVRLAGEGYPAMDAIQFDVEGLAAEGAALAMPTPAVDELMRPGRNPFVFKHGGTCAPGGFLPPGAMKI